MYDCNVINRSPKLLLLIANGVFSMSEMDVVSARKACLQQRANDGDNRADAALPLANNPGSFLSTVQIGVTLVGILAGALALIPGQANPPGYFCSPDSIAGYTDKASGETYLAIANQCNYRLAIYRWADVSKSFNPSIAAVNKAPAGAEPATAGKTGKKKGKNRA